MANSNPNSHMNPLFLLKERLIKVETLLEKYAQLTRKYNNLENSFHQAIENEKKAKKDAARYLEKYCKISKKCDSLVEKIKHLENSLEEKVTSFEGLKSEYGKIDSLLQIYKIERNILQDKPEEEDIRKDKDYLVSIVWKLLKGVDKVESKNINSAFFKRFKLDLERMKLNDFRSNYKIKKLIKNECSLSNSYTPAVSLTPEQSTLDSDTVHGGPASQPELSLSLNKIHGNGKKIDAVPSRIMCSKSELQEISPRGDEESDLKNSTYQSVNCFKEARCSDNFCMPSSETDSSNAEPPKDVLFEELYCVQSYFSDSNGSSNELPNAHKSLKDQRTSLQFEKLYPTEIDHRNSNSVSNGDLFEENVEMEFKRNSNFKNNFENPAVSQKFDVIAVRNVPRCRQYPGITKKVFSKPSLPEFNALNVISHSIDYCTKSSETITLNADFAFGQLKWTGLTEDSKINVTVKKQTIPSISNERIEKNLDEIIEVEQNRNLHKASVGKILEKHETNLISNRDFCCEDVLKSHFSTCLTEARNGVAQLTHANEKVTEKHTETIENEKPFFQVIDINENESKENSSIEKGTVPCIGRDDVSNNVLQSNVKCFVNEMQKNGPVGDDSQSRLRPSSFADAEISQILNQVANVRLLSPIKELERNSKVSILKSNHTKSGRSEACNIDNIRGDVVTQCREVSKDKEEKEEELKMKNLNISKKGFDGYKAALDKSTQTINNERSRCRNSCKKNRDLKEINRFASVSEKIIQEMFEKLWYRKIVKKSKMLNRIESFCRYHCICLDSIAFLSKIARACHLKNAKLNTASCKKNKILNPLKFRNSDGRIKIRPSWKVEELMDIIKTSNEEFSCQSTNDRCELNSGVTKGIINFNPPSILTANRSLGWFSRKDSDEAEKKIYDSGAITVDKFFPHLIQGKCDTPINCYKKESENFNINSADGSFSNANSIISFRENGTTSVCGVYDGNLPGNPRLNNLTELNVLKTENSDNFYREKSDDLKDDNRREEALDEFEESKKIQTLPRRSCRIQSRSCSELKRFCSSSDHRPNGLNFGTEELLPSGSTTSKPKTLNNPEVTVHETAPTDIDASSLNLNKKYKLLFGEFDEVSGDSVSKGEEFLVNDADFSERKRKKASATEKRQMKSHQIRNISEFTVNQFISGNDQENECKKKSSKGNVTAECIKREMDSKNYDSDCMVDELPNESGKIDFGFNRSIGSFSERVDREISSNKIQDGNFLDSILTAMSKQAEEFSNKTSLSSNIPFRLRSNEIGQISPSRSYHSLTDPEKETNFTPEISTGIINGFNAFQSSKNDVVFAPSSPFEVNFFDTDSLGKFKTQNSSDRCFSEKTTDAKLKKTVEKEISKFLKVEISSAIEGEEKIKPCVALLEKVSLELIANIMVAEVMANVDEELEDFERPAPPLTQTQHRLMIILAVLSNANSRFFQLNYKILHLIESKIFPETFYWPDDSLEMATRFYTALCKRLNNFKGIWKFCFKAITQMRQRWGILIYGVLQIWPDIVHDADKIQDNLLVNTFVNLILLTPKAEKFRRHRQEEKILALKHLLINFYHFEVKYTIESYTQYVFDSLKNDLPGAVNSLVLISKCRDSAWTMKNVFCNLSNTIVSFFEGNATENLVTRVLDVILQTHSVFQNVDENLLLPSRTLIETLGRLLNSKNLNQVLMEKTVKVLCSLNHLPGTKDVLISNLEKFSSNDLIYAEMKKSINFTEKKNKEKRAITQQKSARQAKKLKRGRNKTKNKNKSSPRKKNKKPL